MSVKITFAKSPKAKSDIAIVTVYEGKKLSPSAKELDKEYKGLIKQAIATADHFEGKAGQVCGIALPKGSDFKKVIALGLGDLKKQDFLAFETIGGNLYPQLKGLGVKQPTFFIDEEKSSKIKAPDIAAAIGTGLRLRAYAFTKYKKPKKQTALKQVDFILSKTAAASKLYKYQDAVADGVYLARDVMNEPPNALYPDSYAKRIAKELGPLGVDVEIISDTQMKKMKFLSAYEVGKGSERKPRIVVMRWHGKPVKKSTKKFTKTPIAFVGKGVTFDTGGISLKPGAGMPDMKMDMGGSAAVVGLMKALASRKSKAQVVAIVGLAENMPSHNAYRPGDIINTMSGKTVEVMNTDAEGRLVLNDCMTFVQKTYKPKIMIDLATLTGAMMVALGNEYCGAFVNNDDLWKKLESASQETGEKLWRMPLDSAYRKEMEGKFSDLANLGSSRYGGACTAAGFLEHFVEEGQTWAHLDIAGKMMQKGDKPTVPAGGVGFGVRVLDKMVADHYE